MPSACCVPKCKGNYRNGPKVSVFSFPSSDEKIEKIIIWTATNVLINNYCSKQNNILSENKLMSKGKKRKLQTLTESKNKKQILSNVSDKENTQ